MFRRRLRWLLFGLAILLGCLVVRLFYLQVIRYGTLSNEATLEHDRKYEIRPDEGVYVYDGSSRSIVLDQELEVVYADPRYVTNKRPLPLNWPPS